MAGETEISLVAVVNDTKIITTELLDNKIDDGWAEMIHVEQNIDSITIFAPENIKKEFAVSWKRNVKTIRINLVK